MKEFDYSEWQESNDRGFHDDWVVDEDYQVVEGIIRPLNGDEFVNDMFSWRPGRKRYFPLAHPEIVGRFAGLADKSEEDLLLFVREYGLLGYGPLARWLGERDFGLAWLLEEAAGDQSGPFIKIPRAVYQSYEDSALNTGDPVNWMLGHATTVNLILRLAESLDNDYRLRQKIDSFKKPERGTGNFEIAFQYFAGANRFPTNGGCKSANPCKNAMTMIGMMLNDNFKGVQRDIYIREEGKPRLQLDSRFRAASLLNSIYWMVADAVLNRTIRQCLYCKGYFVATHAKGSFVHLEEMGQGTVAVRIITGFINLEIKRAKSAQEEADSGACLEKG